MQTHAHRTLEALDQTDSKEAGPSRAAASNAADLQSDAVQASTEAAGGALRQRIEGLLDRGLTDVDALVSALEGCSSTERDAIAADRGLVDRLVQACPLDRLPDVLRAVITDPKWALYHYAVRRGGRDPQAARSLVVGASVEQQMEIVRWAELVGRLHEIVGDAHPDSVFGAGLGARIDAELGAGQGGRIAQRFIEWRQRAAGLDYAGLLGEMARSEESLAAGLVGQPSAWSRCLAAAPEGSALSDSTRDDLDRIALELQGLSTAQLERAFEVRFGLPLPAGLDPSQIRGVWARLAPVPVASITPRMVEKACVDPTGGVEGWMVATFVDEAPRGEGDAEKDDKKKEDEPAAEVDLEATAAEQAAMLDAFIATHGADDALRAAAEAFVEGRCTAADWQAAVRDADQRGVLRAPAAEVEASLRRVAREGADARRRGAAPTPERAEGDGR